MRVVQNQKIPIQGFVDGRMSVAVAPPFIFGDKIRYNYVTQLGHILLVTEQNMKNTNKIVQSLLMFFMERK